MSVLRILIERLSYRKPPLSSLLAAGLAVVGASIAWAQEKEDPKYKITPTLSKESPTGVAVPKDLDAALAELDRMLSKDLREEMRQGGERGMAKYHFGLGTWMRNNWGLWKGLELAKWFNAKGIRHPDDMSGIVLDSYWRHLAGKPIDLEGQVKVYQAYWEKARAEEKVEAARVVDAKAAIKRMMMGLTVAPDPPAIVRFPAAEKFGFRTRYAAPFGKGVLVTAKRFSPESSRRKPNYDVRTFYVDLAARKVHPILTREGETVEDGVVVEGRAYLNCVSGTKGHIIELGHGKRSSIPWPAFPTKPNVPVRLGIERAGGGKPARLLALGSDRLARWDGGRWETIPCGKVEFPVGVLPAQKIGSRLTFRDEGRYEDDKILSWVDLDRPKGLVPFHDHVGGVGSGGPRWENVWDYAVGKDGTWWIATGSIVTNQSLLRWTPKEGYGVALYNDGTAWTGDFFTASDSRDDMPAHTLAVTGVEALGDGVRAIGPHGLFEIRGRTLRRVLRFENVTDDWTPSTLLTVGPNVTLAGGHWGGLFLLERGKDGRTEAFEIGERLGDPVRW